jgi:hypothetical protein
MRARKVISAAVGDILLVCTFTELVWGSFDFYVDFYAMPKEKYGVLTPLRWQDIVFLVAFYLVSGALLYVSFRLLKYAFRRRSAGTM